MQRLDLGSQSNQFLDICIAFMLLIAVEARLNKGMVLLFTSTILLRISSMLLTAVEARFNKGKIPRRIERVRCCCGREGASFFLIISSTISFRFVSIHSIIERTYQSKVEEAGRERKRNGLDRMRRTPPID